MKFFVVKVCLQDMFFFFSKSSLPIKIQVVHPSEIKKEPYKCIMVYMYSSDHEVQKK